MSKESAIMDFKILLLCFSALASASFVTSEKLVVCYYASWAIYRPGLGQFTVDDINVDLCTHVVYTFAGIGWNGIVTSLDPGLDLAGGRDNFAKFTALKKKNPNLKTILAVGGWNEGSAKYSNMAFNPWYRFNFKASALSMIQQYGFDGLDLDWEYPNRRDSIYGEADIDNFSTLIKEIKEEFDKHGLLLSAAVSPAEQFAKLSYDVPTISKYLDWVSIASYSMYGAWDPVTGHNAPLHKGLGDEGADPKRLYTIDNAVEYWLNAGCPPEKLVLGLPFFGRTFHLADASQHGVRSPSLGLGISSGSIGYNDICNIIQTESWTVEYDHLAKVPYTYKDTNWVSFDNAESIAEKVKFGLEYNVTGFMVWNIATDDFRGICGEANVLLKTVNRALGNTDESSTWPNESTTWTDQDNTWTDETGITWPYESSTSSPENSTSASSTDSNYTEPSNSTEPSTSTESSNSTQPSNSTEPTISTESSNSTWSSTAGSTSTTTTETPTKPPVDGSSDCIAEGYYPNPKDCGAFIVCTRDIFGALISHYFVCPANLYWDQTLLTCNWPRFVECHIN